jgi:hypothetical protein
VVYWGGTTLVTEQRPSGKKVLAIFFRNNAWGYRAVPIEPGQISARTLRRGMDRMTRAHAAAAAR